MAAASRRFHMSTRNQENVIPGKEQAKLKSQVPNVRRPLLDQGNVQVRDLNKPQKVGVPSKKQLFTVKEKTGVAVKQVPVLKDVKSLTNKAADVKELKTVPKKETEVKDVKKVEGIKKPEIKPQALQLPVCPISLPEPVPMEVSVAKTPKAEQKQDADLEDAFSRLRFNIEDIDCDDYNNPFLVAEYVNDIYAYLRELETEYSLSEDFLGNKSLNGRFRKILVDWLVLIHMRLSLLQETLFLTVSILDRFLAVDENVTKGQLQLTGVTCMFIASKFEEMYLPSLKDFVYLADNSFTERDMLVMEIRVLDKLGFRLTNPIPLHFLRRFSKAAGAETIHHSLAKYLMELCLLEYEMAHIKPSHLAASALCLAFEVLDEHEHGVGIHEDVWSDTVQYYSHYKYDTLLPIMKRLANLCLKAGSTRTQKKAHTVLRKYSGSKFLQISINDRIYGNAMKFFASLE